LNENQYNLLSQGKMIEIRLESKNRKVRYPPLELIGDYPCISGSKSCTQPEDTYFLRRF